MSTLQALSKAENSILEFITQTQRVSDYDLKNHYETAFSTDDFPTLYEIIDFFIEEGMVKRVYESNSQVPYYVAC